MRRIHLPKHCPRPWQASPDRAGRSHWRKARCFRRSALFAIPSNRPCNSGCHRREPRECSSRLLNPDSHTGPCAADRHRVHNFWRSPPHCPCQTTMHPRWHYRAGRRRWAGWRKFSNCWPQVRCRPGPPCKRAKSGLSDGWPQSSTGIPHPPKHRSSIGKRPSPWGKIPWSDSPHCRCSKLCNRPL